MQLSVYDNGGFAVFQLFKNRFKGAAVFVVFGDGSISKAAVNDGLPDRHLKLLHFNSVLFYDVPDPAIVGCQLDNGALRANFKRPIELKKRGLYHHAARLELQTKAGRRTRLHNKAVSFGVEHHGISHA